MSFIGYYNIKVINNHNIGFIVITTTITLYWLLAESSGCFSKPVEFENVANLDFKDIKHLHNPGYLLLTIPSMPPIPTGCIIVPLIKQP